MTAAAQILLSAEGIDKRFGGVQALRDARVEVREAEVHALIGENGAGKSTLGKILAGVHRPDAGTIRLRGEVVAPANPLEAQRLGIGIIFQELDLFPHLTVGENIAIANLHFREGWTTSRWRLEAFCRSFLERVRLDVPSERMVCELSMGQLQLVAIARALSMEARVIIMDEATSSLTGDAVQNLFEIVGRLREEGVAIIYVSHRMAEILRVADRVTVFRDGRYIGTKDVEQTSAPELIQMMVGRELSGKERSQSHATTKELLRVDGIRTPSLRDVSFTLHEGEVLGVAGLVGAGRSEIGRALFGLDRLTGGTIALRGERYAPRAPRAAMRRGVGLAPEDRKLEGLMMQLSVRENASLSSLGDCSHAGWLRSAPENERYGAVAERTRLKAASPADAVSTLSGGNQQKVLLGRWLMVNPDVLFLDEPTRGVDVGAKEDVYQIIEELAAAGKGIVMVSSELPELLRCCDRILVMRDGAQAGCVDAGAATQEEVMFLATATSA